MKKLLSLFIGIITLFLIAEPVKANIIVPTVAETFLGFLIALFTSPAVVIILLPIIIGLIFHRKFVAIWNFISMFAVIFLTGLMVENPFRVSELFLLPYRIFSLISFALLYSSFFTMLAFLSSSIGKRFQKINNLQEVFNRAHNKFKIAALFAMYLLLLSPIIYFANFPGTANISEISVIIIVIIGWLIAIVASAVIFYWIYKKSKSMTKKDLIFEKKDYLYLGFLLLIFIISFILAFGTRLY